MDRFDMNSADSNFKYDLARQFGGEEIMSCYTCLTCVLSCPVTRMSKEFNPARIIRMAILGFKKEVLESDFIWLCSSCYACQERCPMGVRITDFITLLKNIAVKEGNIPAGIRAQLDLIKSNGRIYPLDDFDNKKREKIDLPSLPISCSAVNYLFPKR